MEGQALLFVGDAEWDGAYKEGEKGQLRLERDVEFAQGQAEGTARLLQDRPSWQRQRHPVGMTPAAIKGEPLAILNAILPEKSKAKAKAIVSTRRGNYETIPRTDLLAEIGKRVSNTKNYADAFQKAGKKTSAVPKFGKFEEQSFRSSSPCAPISNACCRSRRASLTSRSRRKRAGPTMKAGGVGFTSSSAVAQRDLRLPRMNE
jgi:hypothetical protein